MDKKMKFKYFYGAEADQFSFYRIPKALFTDSYFKDLSSDAKILYGLMLDRMSLSIKNQWFDENNRAYIYFSIEDIMELLNCGRNELAEWKQATVQFNYHIAVDRIFYSVPYQYIKNKVDVRITDTTVEIFYNHNRIASHRRLYGRSGQYSTVTEHMPQEHQKYLEWNGDRFRKWADSIGINTSKVVDAILTSGRIEQQSYRSCMGLLKLAEKYSPEKLEQVCAKALSYSGKPSYKSIKNLLAATKDAPDTESESSQAVKPHGITRGARYYGGKKS